jgi:hypothetical protein
MADELSKNFETLQLHAGLFPSLCPPSSLTTTTPTPL